MAIHNSNRNSNNSNNMSRPQQDYRSCSITRVLLLLSLIALSWKETHGFDGGEAFGLSDATALSSSSPNRRSSRMILPNILLNNNDDSDEDTMADEEEDLSTSTLVLPELLLVTEEANDNQQQYQQKVAPLVSLPQSTFHSNQSNNSVRTTLRSTGTTIAGLVLKDGTVILGADTRATDDRMVADKYCSKIHPLVEQQMYACGAGTSGDLEALTRQVRFEMQLQRLQWGSIGNGADTADDDSSLTQQVISLLKNALYKAAGSLGVNLIIGSTSGSLIALHPHGSMEQVPFAALGSGGMAAMGVLENGYKPTMSVKKAKKLVMAAIQAGIDNDLGSGSQVDLCVMKKGKKVDYIRAAAPAEELTVTRSTVVLSDDSSSSGGGVNGFGNLAYQEQSRRTVVMPDDDDRTEEQDSVPSDWDKVLGL